VTFGPREVRSPNTASVGLFIAGSRHREPQRPASVKQAGGTAYPASTAHPTTGYPRAMRILVIEDNSDIAANLGDYLEDRGHTVDFAADGVTGLHLAVVNDFDAIVLDLNLPGMDGLEVCRKLREEARKQT